MAVWQYNFQLIGNGGLENIDKDMIIIPLIEIFGVLGVKDNNKILLGNKETDDCIITLDALGCILDIHCRLDLRIINQKKISILKGIIQDYNLKLLVTEERILEGEDFIQHLKQSTATKFLEDPENFLKNIG